MKFKIDLHVHTIASAHAYSTLEEIVKQAKEKSVIAFAMTDHGPAAPDGSHRYFFSNMKVIPKFINGIRIFKGIECNIIDEHGNLDLVSSDLDKMEIVLAGFHKLCGYESNSIEKNTQAIIKTIKSGYVDILAHIGNPMYPIDYEKVLLEAKKNKVAIEINNSSFKWSRKGSSENCKTIIKLAKKIGNLISLGSDSHISFDVCNLEEATKLIDNIEYSEKLIINRSLDSVESFLIERRKLIEKNA